MSACVLIASGPSFSEDQARLIDQHRSKIHLLVCNMNFRRFPDADVLYAADPKWWDHFHDEVFETFRGECWTCRVKQPTGTVPKAGVAEQYGLCCIELENGVGVSSLPSTVGHGSNGGYQMIGLADYLMRRIEPVEDGPIILVGYDMQHTGGRKHHHPDYPAGFGNADGVDAWVKNFDRLAADFRAIGRRVINCTLETALTQFERADLQSTLEAL